MQYKINAFKNLSFKRVKSIESVKNKAILLGAELINIDTELYALIQGDSITVISEFEMQLGESFNGDGIFEKTKFKTIDLRNVHTENVKSMESLFKS